MINTAAIFITPIIIGLLMSLPPLIFGGYLLAWSEFALFAVPAYAVSLIGLIVFGIPIVHLLRKYNQLNFLTLSVAGAIAGVVVFSIFIWLLSEFLGSYATVDIKSISWGLVLGCLSALIYGYISGITRRSS
jgi:hypothetical protein